MHAMALVAGVAKLGGRILKQMGPAPAILGPSDSRFVEHRILARGRVARAGKAKDAELIGHIAESCITSFKRWDLVSVRCMYLCEVATQSKTPSNHPQLPRDLPSTQRAIACRAVDLVCHSTGACRGAGAVQAANTHSIHHRSSASHPNWIKT